MEGDFIESTVKLPRKRDFSAARRIPCTLATGSQKQRRNAASCPCSRLFVEKRKRSEFSNPLRACSVRSAMPLGFALLAWLLVFNNLFDGAHGALFNAVAASDAVLLVHSLDNATVDLQDLLRAGVNATEKLT